MLTPPPAWKFRHLLTALLTAFLLELLFITTTSLHVYHHLRYLQLLCKSLVKISHSCSTIVPNKKFKILIVYTFKPPIFPPISLAFPSHSLAFYCFLQCLPHCLIRRPILSMKLFPSPRRRCQAFLTRRQASITLFPSYQAFLTRR
jgi:hypothetical protein